MQDFFEVFSKFCKRAVWYGGNAIQRGAQCQRMPVGSLVINLLQCERTVVIMRDSLEATMKLPFLAVALSLAALFVAQPSQAQNAFTPDQVK